MNNGVVNKSDTSGKVVWVILAAIIICLFGVLIYSSQHRKFIPIKQIGSLQISSPSFKNGDEIPRIYTCRSDAINPPLIIKNIPKNTKSLALIFHNPDAPAKDFAHWLMWNIKPPTKTIAANSVPIGAMQGTNDFVKIGYAAPCPPSGMHTYYFDLYALNTKLNLTEQAQYSDLLDAIKNHVISQTSLSATSTK